MAEGEEEVTVVSDDDEIITSTTSTRRSIAASPLRPGSVSGGLSGRGSPAHSVGSQNSVLRAMSRTMSMPVNGRGGGQHSLRGGFGSLMLMSSSGKPLTSLTDKVVDSPRSTEPVSVPGRRLSTAAANRRTSKLRGTSYGAAMRTSSMQSLRVRARAW